VPAEPTTPAVLVRGLVKRYGTVTALDGLDLTVPRGACFGLLGPNGAGKTTTIHILCTLANPTDGRAEVLGRDVTRERAAVRGTLGLVFQEASLDRELSARENLDIHARLYHLPDRRRRVEEMLALVDLAADARRPVRHFSGGMKGGSDRDRSSTSPRWAWTSGRGARSGSPARSARARSHDHPHHPLPRGGRRPLRRGRDHRSKRTPLRGARR
jgi:ABC-type phosphonate transport system ATPase subunit